MRIIVFGNLDLGKYYVKELETLDGFVLDKTKHYIELNYKDINNSSYIFKTNQNTTYKVIFGVISVIIGIITIIIGFKLY